MKWFIVQIMNEMHCTVKQVEFLRADRFERLHRLQENYNVNISFPRKLPTAGQTEISVRGNRRQLQNAIPMTREALQGLIQWEISIGEMIHPLLTASSIQMQRLALESHSTWREQWRYIWLFAVYIHRHLSNLNNIIWFYRLLLIDATWFASSRGSCSNNWCEQYEQDSNK